MGWLDFLKKDLSKKKIIHPHRSTVKLPSRPVLIQMMRTNFAFLERYGYVVSVHDYDSDLEEHMRDNIYIDYMLDSQNIDVSVALLFHENWGCANVSLYKYNETGEGIGTILGDVELEKFKLGRAGSPDYGGDTFLYSEPLDKVVPEIAKAYERLIQGPLNQIFSGKVWDDKYNNK